MLAPVLYVRLSRTAHGWAWWCQAQPTAAPGQGRAATRSQALRQAVRFASQPPRPVRQAA